MSHILHSPSSKMSLSKTVNALKKGMADTGAEMTKLGDELKQVGEASSLQSKTIKRIMVALYNISVSLNILQYLVAGRVPNINSCFVTLKRSICMNQGR